jgi:hypothetical protein
VAALTQNSRTDFGHLLLARDVFLNRLNGKNIGVGIDVKSAVAHLLFCGTKP